MDLTKEVVQLLIGHGAAQVGVPKELKNGDQFTLVPEGFELQTFAADKHALLPYIDAAPSFTSVESFVAYVREYRTDAMKLFGLGNTLTAILDYHVKDKPDHLRHRAYLNLTKTVEWDRWLAAHGQFQAQNDFAEFLEENRLNIIEPVAASLIEVITNLQSKSDVQFSSQVRSSDGTITLMYSENQETTGGRGEKMPLPQKIRVGLPVFRGYKDNEGKAAIYPLEFFLRLRISHGKANFLLKADGYERVVQAALDEIYQRIETDLGLKILEGSYRG